MKIFYFFPCILCLFLLYMSVTDKHGPYSQDVFGVRGSRLDESFRWSVVGGLLFPITVTSLPGAVKSGWVFLNGHQHFGLSQMPPVWLEAGVSLLTHIPSTILWSLLEPSLSPVTVSPGGGVLGLFPFPSTLQGRFPSFAYLGRSFTVISSHWCWTFSWWCLLSKANRCFTYGW